jgi:ribose transport system permease protein
VEEEVTDTPPSVWTRFRAGGPVVGLLSLLGLFAVLLVARGQFANFFSVSNMQVLLHKNGIPAVVALGMLLVVVSGGIDLSVGSVVALVTVVTMQVFRLVHDGPEGTLPRGLVADLAGRGLVWTGTHAPGWASIAAVGAGFGVGTLCGLVNGLVVSRLRLTPFVATLGMLSVARGLAVWLAGRSRVGFSGGRPEWVDALSQTSSDTFVLDPGVWSVFLLAAVVFVALRATVFGRHCYAIGANESAARLCGLRVERHKVRVYVLGSLFAAWAGILSFAHGNGGDPNAGTGLELDVIAALVIGGASLSGGQGGVGGTLVGVLILGILENGMGFFDVPIEVKYILIGVIVVLNTALSGWRGRKAG